MYHTSQSLRSSLGGWGWGWDTPPGSARFLPSLSHHVWLGFYFLHFLWYLAPWCIFVHFCSLARVLPISLVTKIVCFPSVNLAATQIRWTLTYWAVCHWYVVRWGVSSTHRTRVECWRQFACPPDQQSHCLATVLDDVDGVRVGHALRLVAIYLQNLVAHPESPI